MASVLGDKLNVRFRLEANGKALGTINAEGWRAWDFSIQDPNGSELARTTKTAAFGKENFTKPTTTSLRCTGRWRIRFSRSWCQPRSSSIP